MTAFLTDEDLRRVTGKKRFKAQCRVLDGMGIAYRKSATGEPLVRVDDLDGKRKQGRNREPRWDRLNA